MLYEVITNTMKLKHRVFFDDLGIKAGETTFAHGTNTPDMKKFLLTVNLTPEGFTKWTGNTKLMYLDMAALEEGKIKKLAEGTIRITSYNVCYTKLLRFMDGAGDFSSSAPL